MKQLWGTVKSKALFLKFAAMAIRHRLIDYYRKEKRHMDIISIYSAAGEEEDETLIETLDSGSDEIEDSAAKEK